MGKWRAKTYQLKLSRTTRLSLTLRRFRTAKRGRAKTYRQLVLSVDFYRIREIAIRLEWKHKKRKSTHPSLPQRLRTVAPRALIVSGIIGSLSFGYVIANAQSSPPPVPVKPFAPAVSTPPPAPVPLSLPRSEPTHIAIPDLGIDYDVISVGQDAGGKMETPPIGDWTVGWYRLSPTPGEIGPAVMVGHLNDYVGGSVFWRLREIQPGSLIHITRADGKVATFKATTLSNYSQTAFPTNEVYGNIAHAGLRLITCSGTYDPQTGYYTENTVVYAELVPS